MPDLSQFNTDRTYPGRWAITFSNLFALGQADDDDTDTQHD